MKYCQTFLVHTSWVVITARHNKNLHKKYVKGLRQIGFEDTIQSRIHWKE